MLSDLKERCYLDPQHQALPVKAPLLSVGMISVPQIFNLFSSLSCSNVQGGYGNTETLKFTGLFILCRLYWKVKWDKINLPV